MKKRYMTIIVVTFVLTLTLVLGSLAIAQDSSDSQSRGAAFSGDDSNPIGPPTIIIPPQFQVPADRSAEEATAATTDVYFTPQDENTSTTVLFLYNTSGTAAQVSLKTFTLNGNLAISIPINIPARSMVRIAGDEPQTITPSWNGAIWIDFRNESAYAMMTLPEGVKADGYVAWTNNTIYDPLQVAPTLSLRFSTDPNTAFLPSVRSN